MKSVGESMALGRTFQESFNKAVRSLECGYSGWGCAEIKELDWDWVKLKESLRVPSPERIHSIYAAMRKGMTVDEIHELSYIDKWFLTQLKDLVDVELYLSVRSLSQLTTEDMYEVKKRGFSDKQIAFATKSTEKDARIKRLSLGVVPAYKRVDTCAAEFEANTPYMYSCYDNECESLPTERKKVLILGGGPNRIGQGIEFDYCCCHTSFAHQEAGFETIMMNSNPETVSTDYDTSDRLYFEPLTVEDVLNIIDLERPDGIIVQFGGQTPRKLALPIEQYLNEHKLLAASGTGYVCIWGTYPDSIDAAEDRERFNAILNELKIEQPKGGIAKSGADVEGGNLIRTDESIINGGDLHFAEIIYTNGPKGMRVFNVFLQEEKVLSELDIYSVVGANKPLQLLDGRVSVGEDGEIALSFEGVHGSPVVSRICIMRAPKPPDPPAGGLIDLHSMSKKKKKKKKRKIEQKQVPIYIYFLALCLATFPPQGAPSFAAMVGSDAASTRNSVGHPPGKKRENSLTGGGNKSQISLHSLKFKFNLKKPTLDSMVIAYQWVRGCFLEHEVDRLKIIRNQIPQDWMLHGLWPSNDADQCYDDFNEEKILRNQDFLKDLLRNWASLKRDIGDVDGNVRFWKKQWLKHGVKSRLPQKLYMKLALHLHNRYKHLLTDAMNIAKASDSAFASFDSALGTRIFTISTSAFELAIGDILAAPKLKWIKLGENKYALKEVQLKIYLLSDDYEVHDMDKTGGTPPLELIL